MGSYRSTIMVVGSGPVSLLGHKNPTGPAYFAPQTRVEVDHHPPTARAPLASHPRTTLHVIDAPLEASHAGALLIGGTRPLGGHDDHAKSSSMSWSKRSSTLGLIRPLLVAHSR